MKTYWGVEAHSHAFLISALGGGKWSASRPGSFIPRERDPGIHWIGGWVGPRIGLDAVVWRKIPRPYLDSNPQSSSPQPSAIPTELSQFVQSASTPTKFREVYQVSIYSTSCEIPDTSHSSFQIQWGNSRGLKPVPTAGGPSPAANTETLHLQSQSTVQRMKLCAGREEWDSLLP
jgi:hypothetical protein